MDSGLETRLRELMRVFLEENAQLNLSALRTEELCWTGNILDSLPLLDIADQLDTVSTVLDLGTGGGFPLLPLAMALPDVRFTGLDATRKKIDAVGRIADSLKLSNVTLVAGRSEELGRDAKHREKYDVVTARAVASLPVLLEYVAPFVKPGGHAVLWKSLHIDDELMQAQRALGELSLELAHMHRYTLPGDFGERQLLVFRKTGPLSTSYPRAVGMAKGKPVV